MNKTAYSRSVSKYIPATVGTLYKTDTSYLSGGCETYCDKDSKCDMYLVEGTSSTGFLSTCSFYSNVVISQGDYFDTPGPGHLTSGKVKDYTLPVTGTIQLTVYD
jgi:hypothetical protein